LLQNLFLFSSTLTIFLHPRLVYSKQSSSLFELQKSSFLREMNLHMGDSEAKNIEKSLQNNIQQLRRQGNSTKATTAVT
jgi:hypothetical protein